MLTIRLTRRGKKNQPFFKIVVIDKRHSPRGGRAVEDVGYLDPLKKRKNLKKERILYWLSKGAKTSETVHNLLVSEKIIDAPKIHVSRVKKSAEQKPQEETKAAAATEVSETSGETPSVLNAESNPVETAEAPVEPLSSESAEKQNENQVSN